MNLKDTLCEGLSGPNSGVIVSSDCDLTSRVCLLWQQGLFTVPSQ
jgi:hypothetical protein